MLKLIINSLVGGISLRTYLIAAVTTAFALWTVHWYGRGYDAADAMWRAKALEAQIEKLKIELQTQREADAAEDRYTAELEAEKNQLQKVIDEYLKELEKRPDKCLLGDDAGRLQ